MYTAKQWLKVLILVNTILMPSISAWSESNVEIEEGRDCVSTRHLQVLVNTNDPSYRYVLFNGADFIYNNIFAPRPFGSYYYLRGLIFPGDTIDVQQSNYTVSREGEALNEANSLGFWWATSKVIEPQLTLPLVPLTPTDLELINCDFLFKPRGISRPNNLFTTGVLRSGYFQVTPQVQPLFTVSPAVTGGTGLNTDAHGSVQANIYFQPSTASLLVDIHFDNPVSYHPVLNKICE